MPLGAACVGVPAREGIYTVYALTNPERQC